MNRGFYFVLGVFIKEIHGEIGHDFDADDEAVFIDVEFRRMRFGDDAFGFVAGTETQEEAGNDLFVVRKIFRTHAFRKFEDIGVADGAANGRQRFFDEFWIVIYDGGDGFVIEIEGCAIRLQ